jgi:hypothetical protein
MDSCVVILTELYMLNVGTFQKIQDSEGGDLVFM